MLAHNRDVSPTSQLRQPTAPMAHPAPAKSLNDLPKEVGCMLFACLGDADSFNLGRVSRDHWAMFTDDSVSNERLRRVHGLTLPAAARQHSVAAAASCARLARRTVRGDFVPAPLMPSAAAPLHRLEAPLPKRCRQPSLGCDIRGRGNQRFSTFSVPQVPRDMGEAADSVRLRTRLVPAAAPDSDQFTDLADACVLGHYVVALEAGLDAKALCYDLTQPSGHLMPQQLRALQPAAAAIAGVVAGAVYSTPSGLAIGAAGDVAQMPLWRI